MKLKTIKTEEAVGHTLCHDITKIVPGEFKGRIFKKGHVVREEDIEVLLSVGKDILYVWENVEGYVHENDAAKRLKDTIIGKNLEFSEIKEGKISLIATETGTLKINVEALFHINMIDEIIVATKPNFKFVKKGDIIASTRVIPLLIHEEKLKEAEKFTGELITIKPLTRKTVAMVTTGNEIYYGRIKDKFRDVMEHKLDFFDCEIVGQTIVPDDLPHMTSAINRYLEENVDLIICTGGMSVDPSDITPTAIKETGSEIVTYGMPVLSGSMTLIAYNGDTPIIGLPAGVLFSEKNTVDVILHRLLCNDKISREEVAAYGVGGLL
ncbi:MAG: molybdopterin-binding protein [Spirochaetaceae bacterium]